MHLHPKQILSLSHTNYESDLFHGNMNEYHGNIILYSESKVTWSPIKFDIRDDWESELVFRQDDLSIIVDEIDNDLVEEYIDSLHLDSDDILYRFYFFENKLEAMFFQNQQNYCRNLSFLIHDSDASEDMEYFIVQMYKNKEQVTVDDFIKYIMETQPYRKNQNA